MAKSFISTFYDEERKKKQTPSQVAGQEQNQSSSTSSSFISSFYEEERKKNPIQPKKVEQPTQNIPLVKAPSFFDKTKSFFSDAVSAVKGTVTKKKDSEIDLTITKLLSENQNNFQTTKQALPKLGDTYNTNTNKNLLKHLENEYIRLNEEIDSKTPRTNKIKQYQNSVMEIKNALDITGSDIRSLAQKDLVVNKYGTKRTVTDFKNSIASFAKSQMDGISSYMDVSFEQEKQKANKSEDIIKQGLIAQNIPKEQWQSYIEEYSPRYGNPSTGRVNLEEREKLVKKAIDSGREPFQTTIERYIKDTSPRNPDFSDMVIQGVGSMAAFWIGGSLVASGTGLKGVTVLPSVLESLTESGSVYDQNRKKGTSATEAFTKSSIDFVANIVLNYALDKVSGIYELPKGNLSKIKKVAEVVKTAGFEGIQEASQQLLSNITTNNDNIWEGVLESLGIGALIGGGVKGTTLSIADTQATSAPITPPTPKTIGEIQKSVQNLDLTKYEKAFNSNDIKTLSELSKANPNDARFQIHKTPETTKPAPTEVVTIKEPTTPKTTTKPTDNLLAEVEKAGSLEEFVKGQGKLVQRIEEKGISTSFDKPQGLYTTPSNVESPHLDLGGDKSEFVINPKANVLTVSADGRPLGIRGIGGSSAGVLALERLASKDIISEFNRASKKEAENILFREYPELKGNKALKFYDSQDVMEAYAGKLARDKGYDIIENLTKSTNKIDKQFEEVVILNKDIIKTISQLRAEYQTALKATTPKVAVTEETKPRKVLKTSKAKEVQPKSSSGLANLASPQGKKTIRQMLERQNQEKVSTPQETPKDFKISERAKGILTEFGMVSGEGGLSNRFLGLFKFLANKVRVQAYYDITTVTHEGVHGIDKQIGFSKKIIADPLGRVRGGIRSQLTDIYEKLYPAGKRTHKLEKRIQEGLATFFENYFYNPTNTAQAYPKLVDAFIKPTGKYYDPLFIKLLDRMNTLVEDYSKLSPEDKFASRIRTGKEIVDEQTGFTSKQRVVFEVLNRFEPFKRYAKEADVTETWADPMVQAFNILNKNTIVENWVRGGGTPILLRDGNFRIEKGTVADYIKLTEGNEKNFRSYLVARRVFEANNNVNTLKNELAVLEGQGITEDMISTNREENPIKIIKEKIDKIQKVIEADDFSTQDATAVVQKYANQFSEAEKIYDNINKRLIDFAEENDMISSTTANTYRAEKGYASFRRFIDDELDSLGTVRTSSKSRVSSFKERTGSQLDIVDPIYSQILAINEIIGKGMENRLWNIVDNLTINKPHIAQRFEKIEAITAVDAKGRISYPQERDPNIIRFFKEGKREFRKAGQEFLAVSKTLKGKEFDAFVQILRIPSSVFTRLTTSANPYFAVGNMTVDQFSATTQTKVGYKPIVDPVKGLTDYIKGDEAMKAYFAIGGKRQTLSAYFDLSPDEVIKSLTGGDTKLEKVTKAINSTLGVLEFPSNTSEIITRFGEFKRAVARGESMSVAMYRASEVTVPFQLSGNFGGRLGQEYIKSIPYLNASIQVLYKFGRTAKENPKRVATMLAAIFAIGLSSAILVMKNASEKQKRLLSEQPVRNMSRYLYFPSPNKKDLIKVRIPEQFGVFTGMAYIYVIQRYEGNKASFNDYLNIATSAVPEQINFTQPKKQILSFIPQVLKPSVSVASNTKTYPEVLPIVPQYMLDKKPSEQYNNYTSRVGKFLGQLTNASPILVDYWVKNQFGVVGGLLVDKTPTNPINIQEKDFVMSGRSYNQFYDNRTIINQQYEDTKDNPKKYNEQDIYDIKEQKNMYGNISTMLSDMRKINKVTDLPDDIKSGMYDLLINLDNRSIEQNTEKTYPLLEKIDNIKLRYEIGYETE